MITAVLTSDNHLGAYYTRFRPDRLEGRRQALQRGFEQVVEAAIGRRADLFLHAGDLFDRPDPRNAERCFVARQLRHLQEAGIPVFAVAGNHDSPRRYGYDGGTLPHAEMEALGAVRLFGDRSELQRQELVICGQRVCVWGMSCDANLPADFCPLEEQADRHERGGDLDLVLLHHGVEGWAPPMSGEACLSRANLERLNTDALGVGHLHVRNDARLASGALLLNPGATERIHFGEEAQECGFWVLHCAPGQVEAEYVRLTPQPMLSLPLELTDAEFEGAAPEQDGAERVMQRLLGEIEAEAKSNQLLRLRLRGRVRRSRFHALNLATLQARGSELNFHCQLDSEGLVVYDQFGEITVVDGVSFDAGEELRIVAQALAVQFAEDLTEQEIYRLASERIAADYSRLTGGAR